MMVLSPVQGVGVLEVVMEREAPLSKEFPQKLEEKDGGRGG